MTNTVTFNRIINYYKVLTIELGIKYAKTNSETYLLAGNDAIDQVEAWKNILDFEAPNESTTFEDVINFYCNYAEMMIVRLENNSNLSKEERIELFRRAKYYLDQSDDWSDIAESANKK